MGRARPRAALASRGTAAAARHALRVYLDQLAVLVHALIAQEHPSVVAEVGCLLSVGAPRCCVEGIASWRYSVLVHSGHPFCGPGPGLARAAGPFSLHPYFTISSPFSNRIGAFSATIEPVMKRQRGGD